jgi:hypothetical protein
MQIQQDSPYAKDENPAALLAGAEIEAAHLSRSLKIVCLWSQSSALTKPRREEMAEEEQRLANLYAAMLYEIGSAFGLRAADELKTQIEAACILEDWECPPAEQGLLFPILGDLARQSARPEREGECPSWKLSAKLIPPGSLGGPSTMRRAIT